ncbi:multiple epidermal growth factor-like domains protein 10 isoform X12 [Haliotis rubra]|uniref:multiple epidermal growth factor-like domains protein 10 isoform X12 n=1 Tax=Haliotis rubra TaxID=36100 RepID=UPI001EE5877D|nr:multiple epidermal growth factor-like domains protein 10 isoform X12 [Haliotis rubra]
MAVSDGVVILLASFSLVTGTVTNVAEGKQAWMSSTFDDNHPASKAVDGDTRADDFSHVAYTGRGRSNAWWKVDLQTSVQSARVILYFRTDFILRRNGVHLYTSKTNSSDPKEGNLCLLVTGRVDGIGIPDVLNVTCPGTWRYLTVYTGTGNNGAGFALDFAEVQVWMCAPGQYGANCAKDCSSRHCKTSSSTCDRISGACPTGGCDAGWMGTDCTTVCAPGQYGANCAKDCSSRHCKTSSSTCDRISGACPTGGCDAGWMGTDCTTACTNLMYGPNCVSSCSARHCKTKSSTCDGVSGECLGGCEDGWTEIDCSSKCHAGYYGQNCHLKCDDRHCTSASCTGDGACSAECEPGWTLRDCTQECPSGTYGIICNKTCGQCANDDTCHHVTGICADGCEAGWQGDLCQKGCGKGTFGSNCESRCGNCNGTCNVVDGRCLWGCTEGYNGPRCSVELPLCVAKIGVIGRSYRNGYRNGGHAAAGCCSVHVSAETWKTEMDSLKWSRSKRRKKDRLH